MTQVTITQDGGAFNVAIYGVSAFQAAQIVAGFGGKLKRKDEDKAAPATTRKRRKSKKAIKKVLGNRPWPDKDVAELVDLASRGAKVIDLARRFGRTPRVVKMALTRAKRQPAKEAAAA